MTEAAGMKEMVQLFFTFLKIGIFTFGGGYAMIALLRDEFVTKKKWIDHDTFIDMVAISESTPGPIAVNSATYIGYQTAGGWGAFVATVAVCIPSFSIIYVISLYFDRFLELTYVGYALEGIQACVVYLIFSAAVRMTKEVCHTLFHKMIVILVFAAMLLFSLLSVSFSAVFYIGICGLAGVAQYLAGSVCKRRSEK